MADSFPIGESQIVALFLETLFAGVNIVTFGFVFDSLILKRANHDRFLLGQYWLLLSVALALFLIAMFDAMLQLTYVLDAFIWFQGEGGADAKFDDISYWQDSMKTLNYCVQTSIADFMLVYRCHIIYGKRWLLTLPLTILWLGGVATGLTTSISEFMFASATSNHLNTGVLIPLITSNVSITLALNLIATSLIVWKIRTTQRANRRALPKINGSFYDGASLQRAMRIFIESGAMYSISIIIFLPLYIVSSNAQIGVSDAVVQIIGISFNLIIIRISQGRTIEHTTASEDIPLSTRPTAVSDFSNDTDRKSVATTSIIGETAMEGAGGESTRGRESVGKKLGDGNDIV